MRKVIEWTLVSADGAFDDPVGLDLYPVLAGSGQQFSRDGRAAKVRLAAVKTFSKIVKMTYELQH